MKKIFNINQNLNSFIQLKFLAIICGMLLWANLGWGQTTIASDGLNNSSTLFTLVNGAYYSGSTPSSGCRPTSSPYAVEGTYSRGSSNATATLTSSSDINTSAYTSVAMSLRVASFDLSGANGADAGDIITVEISPNGGTNYYSTTQVKGNTNAAWAFSATGNANTAYDGDASPVVFAPAGGGLRTTDGYSTITISSLPQVSSLRIRITLLNNDANERWIVDDFKITGTPSSCSGEPTAQATNITFSNVGTSSMDVSWTAGTGGDNYILVCKQGGNVSWTPTDNADYTAATGSGNFTSATDQGSGNKVVFDGSATTATISGLSQGTTYYFQVFHYCENGGTENYITSTGTNNTGAQNQATTTGPIKYQGFEGTADDNWNYSGGTISASTARFYVGAKSGLMDGAQTVTFDNVDISAYENVVLSVAFSASGPDSDDDLYLDISYDNGSTWTGTGSVKLVDGYSNANIAFGATSGSNPTTVASNPWPVNISSSETQIKIRFRYLAGASGDIYYIDDISLDGDVAAVDPEPTNQPTSFAIGTVTTSNIPLSWTAAVVGSQAPDGYLIKGATSAPADPSDATDPSEDLSFSDNAANHKITPYTATSYSSFTNYAVGTMYYFGIWSYTNSSTDIDFKTTGEPTLYHATLPNAVTGTGFTVTGSTTADISWSKATGHSDANHTTLVFVKATSSVTVGTPDNDDSYYTASTNFGTPGTAYEADGSAYCVYKGDGASVSVTGLNANTTYYVLFLNVVDASNSNSTNSYSASATTNGTTAKAEPTNYPTVFACGTTTSSSIPLTWTAATVGSQAPDYYLIKWSSVSYGDISDPVDGIGYADAAGIKNITYGTNTYTPTSLTQNTTYYFKIWTYTLAGGYENYKTGSEPQTSCATLEVSACGLQEFDSGTTEPEGWTFTGIGDTYTNACVSNGLKMDATGDAIETANVTSPSELSFYIQGNGLSVPNTTSSLLVEGYNGSWNTIQDITGTGLTNSCVQKSFTSVSSYTKFRFTYTKGTGNLSFDDVYVNCASCTPPTTQATLLTYSNLATTTLTVGWTRGTGTAGVIVVAKASSATTADPASGSSYSADANYGGTGSAIGGGKVVYIGTGTSVNLTGLSAETNYYFNVYEYNTTGTCYLTPALSGTRYSLSTEPTAHPATFSATAISYSQIDLTFSAASTISNADGYIILRRQDATNPTITNVNDGSAPNDLLLPAGTTLVTTIISTATTSYSDIGLTGSTQYNYAIIAYNANVTPNGETYNYYTGGTIKTANATTPTGPSNSSDIITANNETANINYASKTGNTITATTDGIRVWSFTVRDGGGSSDADAFGTVLTSVIIDKGTSNGVSSWANTIKEAALFDGSTKVSEVSVTGESIIFTGLSGANVTAADNGSKTLDLYVTFETSNIVDNQQFQFRIQKANTTTDATKSGFSSFTDVISSITGDNNRIEVTATILYFSDVPTSTPASTNFTATVCATDANYNSDLDVSPSITVSRNSGTGTLSSTAGLVQTAISGCYSWSDLQYGTEEDFQIQAVASGLTTAVSGIISCQSGLVIGTGTVTENGNFYGPFNNYWENNRVQMLYLQSELGTTKTITGIAFDFSDYTSNANYRELQNFKILFRNTATTSFGTAYESMSGSTTVYNVATLALPATTGWFIFDINDYNYNGTSNLIVEIKWGDNEEYISSINNIYSVNMTTSGTSYLSTWGYADEETPPVYDGRSYSRPNLKVFYNSSIPPVQDELVANKCLTTADVTWVLPGGYDNATNEVIVFAKATSSITIGTPSNNISTYTANSIFGSGTAYQNDASAKCVYKGDGTSVSITGLSAATTYYFLIFNTKNGNLFSVSATTQGTTISAISNVTSPTASSGDGSFTINWTNPTTCYEEVMIVVRASASNTATPSGNGSAYTGNLVYGSGTNTQTNAYVVYEGNASGQTISSLTNGTVYYIKFFTRNGSSWSSGIEITCMPVAAGSPTVLESGDFAILSVNANNGACGISGEDIISFVCFKDIGNGTTIDMTDNGWERCNTGYWGNQEGGARFTRTGGVIPAGTVITLKTNQGSSSTPTTWIIFSQPDDQWQVDNLGTYAPKANFNLNVGGDQVYFMQGGTWNGGTSLGNNATYTGGTILFAFSTNGTWEAQCHSPSQSVDNQNSNLYPGLSCFKMSPTGATDFNKYTGSLDTASQRDWIDRINNPDNWSSYASCTDWDVATPAFEEGGMIIPITIGGFNNGLWIGGKGINGHRWNNCECWQNMKIPDATTNVAVSASASKDIWLDDDPDSLATCNNLTLSSINIYGEEVGGVDGNTIASIQATSADNTDTYITINGILTISGGIINLDDGDGGTTDSKIILKGNWVNNVGTSAFEEGNGTVEFSGTAEQSITSTATENFENIIVNNTSATGIVINNDIEVEGTLTLTDGVITTSTNKVNVSNSNATTGISGATNASFINGNLQRAITSNTNTYSFPVGDGTATTNFKKADFVNNSLTGLTSLTVNVASESESGNNIDTRLAINQDGTPLNNIMESAIWTIEPQGGWSWSSGSYGINLYVANTGLSASDDNKFCPVKRANTSSDYADWSTFVTAESTTIPAFDADGRIYSGGAGYAQRAGYKSFSKHAIAKGDVVLPIELVYFKASLLDKKVLIEWETASEINNDYFTIERSMDGISFNSFSIVDGAGNSNSTLNYSAIDNNPLNGISYYRLKQTDFDGKYSYSNIVSVYIENQEIIQNLWYNKDDNKINIEINSTYSSEYIITAYDICGKQIINKKAFIDGKMNLKINTDNIPSGIYTISIISDYCNFNKKIVIITK